MEEESFSPRLMTIGQLASYYFPYEDSIVIRLLMFRKVCIEEGIFRYLSINSREFLKAKTVIQQRYVWVVVRHLGWPPFNDINKLSQLRKLSKVMNYE